MKTRLDLQLEQGITLEYDLIDSYGSESQALYTELIDSTDVSLNGVQQNSIKAVGHLKMTIANNQVVTTLNNSTWTQSINYSEFYWRWWTGGNRGFRIANMKLKAL